MTPKGILICSGGKFLLCHATKRKDDVPKQYDGSWTISKGIVDEEESPIDAAIRELKEETNVDLRKYEGMVPSPSAKPQVTFQVCSLSLRVQVRDKQVLVYIVDDPDGIVKEQETDLRCGSLIEGHPPDSAVGHLNGWWWNVW